MAAESLTSLSIQLLQYPSIFLALGKYFLQTVCNCSMLVKDPGRQWLFKFKLGTCFYSNISVVLFLEDASSKEICEANCEGKFRMEFHLHDMGLLSGQNHI